MSKRISLLSLFVFAGECAFAICTAPTGTSVAFGQTGEVKMSVGATLANKMMVCDGTTWLDIPGSPTATACVSHGQIVISGGEIRYCNNSLLWNFDSIGGTNGSCSVTGEMKWNTGTTQLEFCNGTNWRTVSKTDAAADAVTMTSTTGGAWDSFASEVRQVTGFSGGTGTFTFNTASCPNGVNAKVCADSNCTTTLSNLTTNGSAYVPNGSYISLAFRTAGTALTNCSISADVGGQTLTFGKQTASTDTSINYVTAFTEVRSQTNGNLITSNIVQTTSHSDVTIAVSDEATGGTPQFRICSDASCASEVVTWGSSSQTLSNYHYVQLRTTAGPTTNSLRRVSLSGGTGTTPYWNVLTSTCPKTTTLAPGASLTCTCPTSYLTVIGAVNGVGNYSQASDLCAAALHAGAFSNASGGSITVIGTSAGSPSGTCATFQGNTTNSVPSTSSSTPATSMYFSGFGSNLCN